MIKTVTKKIFACDMCGYEYAGPKTDLVPKDVFEFIVNLEDGAKRVQICPRCQAKLKNALGENLNKIYKYKGCSILVKGENKDD